MNRFVAVILLILANNFAQAQEAISWKVKVTIVTEIQQSFIKGGRLILHVTKQNEREPRLRSEIAFGVTPQNWDASKPFVIQSKDKNVLNIGLDKLKPNTNDKYYFQVVYKQNIDDGQENVSGNLYSNIDSVYFSNTLQLNLTLNKIIPEATVVKHEFVKLVEIKSKYLSEFSGKARFLKASVLLPSGYFENPDKTYPICYRAANVINLRKRPNFVR